MGFNTRTELDNLIARVGRLTPEEEENWARYVAFVKGEVFKPKKAKEQRSTSLIKHFDSIKAKPKPSKESTKVIKPDWQDYYKGGVS